MGDAARFPEAHRLAPLGLGADPEVVRVSMPMLAGSRPPSRPSAQLVECRDRLVAGA